MTKQSQQKKRHIERQQNTAWWNELRKGDVRTLTLEDIRQIKDPKVRAMVRLWRKLADLGQ